MNLIVANVPVRQNSDGLYCLNDLHHAAGGQKCHQPSDFLRLKQTQDLISELQKPGIPGIQSKQGHGTYVCKELVYCYAMWISARFHLLVIRAYDASVTQEAPSYTQLALAREVGGLRDQISAQNNVILGLYNRLDGAQRGHIRAVSSLLSMQRRQVAHEAKELVIYLASMNVPRNEIAARSGKTRLHVRQIIHQAKKAGILPKEGDEQ